MSTIKLERFIQAPPSEVYRYLTNSTALKDWLCDVATVDPRPGGRLYMWWNSDYYTSGEYIEVKPDDSVSFTWFGRDEPHSTRVEVVLRKKKGGTLLKLAHRKIGKSQKWTVIGDTYKKEWTKGLNNLASVLEDGADLRITTRPMLGILTTDFNPGIAEKLGIPVTQGVRLGGVVEGMGAQKAGLLSDDVIIGMDGHEITTGASFALIIADKHAGDLIEVTYYRCSEKKTIQMTLSGRPIPPIPNSGLELSQQLETVYHHFENEIETLLNSVSEDECTKRPKPSEWSANEVLAHLVHSELGWQNVVNEIMGGHEGAYDGFGGNIQAHIDGTLATFPTKAELFKELKNHDAETLSIYAHIPLEFLNHKGRWWKLAYLASQNSYHLQSHLEQMKAALQASTK